MINKSIKILPLALLFFIGVNGTATASCSCANYYYKTEKNIPAPQWIKRDNIIDGNYFSSGSTGCTSIKSIDEKRAAIDARNNLSKMLGVEVSINETGKTTTFDSIAGSRYTSNATQTSEKLILNGIIYDRWVDTQNCTVYSAIKVTKEDIENGEKLQKQYFSALPFCVKVNGNRSDYVKDKITSELLKNNYTLALTKKCEIEYSIFNSVIETKSHLVKTRLTASIKASKKNDYLLKNSYDGKGVSYNNKSLSWLTEYAIDDAVDNFIFDIEKIKNKRIN